MIKFVAVDFDNTLAYHQGGKVRLFRLLRKYGISLFDIRAIYEQAKKESGLSVESLLRVAKEYTNTPLDREAVTQDVEGWLRDSVACYPDALLSVLEWRNANVPVIIVTVGAPEFQKKKVELSGLPYDDLFVLDAVNKKSATLQALLDHYGSPCIFVDDKATELDAIRESGISAHDVITFRIRRKNSPYYGQRPAHEHVNIKRLDDPLLMAHIVV